VSQPDLSDLGDREYFPGDLDARDVLLWELCSSIVSRQDLSDFRDLVLGENSHRFTERLSTELSETRCFPDTSETFLKLMPSFVPRPDSAVFLELDLGEHSDRLSETLSREKLDLSDCESLPGDLDDREVLPFKLGKLSKEVDDFSDCESLPGDLVLPPQIAKSSREVADLSDPESIPGDLDPRKCECLPGDLDAREVLLWESSREDEDLSDCESLPGDLDDREDLVCEYLPGDLDPRVFLVCERGSSPNLILGRDFDRFL